MAVKVKTLGEFIKWADQFKDGQYLFRGVSNKCHQIEASTYRRFRLSRDQSGTSSEEQEGEFYDLLQTNLALISDSRHQRQDHKDGRQLTDLELLAELQHFGAATCLVDFTRSALVALWFACQKDSSDSPKDGAVVVLRTDGVEPLRTVNDRTLDESLNYFFELDRDLKYLLYQWHPGFQNNRIIAQQSVFVFGNPPIRENAKCTVAGCSKQNILRDLEKLAGITEASLFPDFEGMARVYAHDKPIDTSNASAYRHRGIDAYYDNEWEEAIYWLTKAIDLDPNHLHAYVYLGRVYYSKNRNKDEPVDAELDEAIALYTRAIELDPERALSEREHAMLYVYRGRARYSESKIGSDRDTKLDEVIEDCRCAMELDSECAHAYNLLGTVYFQKSDYEEAIVYFNEAIRYEKEAEPRYRCNRGEAQLHLKEWENALEDLKFAKDRKLNVIASFRNEYESIEDFEREIDVEVPPEIKRLLTL